MKPRIYYESADQRKRPHLYAVDLRTDDDLRRLGIPQRPSLVPTIVLGIVLGCLLAWITRGHTVDPIAQAVGEMIRRLVS